MVHWPEVTFTYDETDKVLFSADAFGTFGAIHGSIFADAVDYADVYGTEGRRYYTNTTGKYGMQVLSALKRQRLFPSTSSVHFTGLSFARRRIRRM